MFAWFLASHENHKSNMPIVYTCKLDGINYALKQAYSLQRKGDAVPVLPSLSVLLSIQSADFSKHNENFVWQVNSKYRCQSGMTRDFTEQTICYIWGFHSYGGKKEKTPL